MNTRILLIAVAVASLSSCSSVYKSGQTPDDVYFSPARPQADADEYVEVPKDGERYQTYEQYQDNVRNSRFLSLSMGNPYYMSAYNMYDGFDWRFNSYNTIYGSGLYSYNSPWNAYYAWNSFYNPYCYSPYVYYGNTSKFIYNTPISRPIAFNAGSYSPSANRASGNFYNNGLRFNNSNLNGGNRYIYNNSNGANHNRNSYTPANNTYTPSRSYTPSSGGGSSAPARSSGGGGSVSRPGRGGR